ncbi:nitroreductase family protein [Capnocytophaga sp. ARDL2]|uniref:nitroreductase family protein n=1 Tax=Capnocytophaga sp. ARDL2 TaxID=3238809 RepID=UPI003557B3D9
MSIIPDLEWRYATKKMNREEVANEKIQAILEAIRLAPTSSGLQPFEVFVVSNPKVKAQLQKAAYNQSQLTECSHVLVFAVWNGYDLDRINHYFDLYEEVRQHPKGFSDGYKNSVIKLLSSLSVEQQIEHAARQAYIALGMALCEAAVQKVDSIPMEGFVAKEVDEILGLDTQRLKTVLLLPLGYKDADNDWQYGQKKVRKSTEHIFTFIE